LPNVPSAFTATSLNSTAINLAFTHGTNSTYVVVRYSTVGYPASPTDGSLACNTTGVTFTHTGLTLGTPYYYSAYGWQSDSGTGLNAYSATALQATASPSSAPSVTTSDATSVTNTTAIIGGQVTSLNSTNATKYWTQYGTTTAYGSWINTTATQTSPFSWSNTTAAVSVGTGYYFKAGATNVMGDGFGSQKTFLTLPNPVSAFTASSYNSTANNLAFTRGTNATYTLVWYKTTGYPASVGDGTLACNTSSATFTHTGLTLGQPYYYAAYDWVSDSGTGLNAYSATALTATATPSSIPSVSTSAASSVANTTATLNGNIDALGAATVTTRGFIYGTVSNSTLPASTQVPPSGYTTNTSSYNAGGFSTGAFTSNITSLTPNTRYYFRSYAYNSQGYGYGSELYMDMTNYPTIATAAATSVTTTTARLQSVLTDAGNAPCQVRWGYGTTNQGNNIAAYDTVTAYVGSYDDGAVPYLDISGLLAAHTYYFNVQALNSVGATTGSVLSFTTGSGIYAPSNVLAIPTANSTILLSWLNSNTTPKVNIRWGENFAPTSNITGTLLYNGSLTTFSHTGLNQGSTYYYFFQGYDNALGFSADNVTVQATVTSVVNTTYNIPRPTAPSWWSLTPTASTYITQSFWYIPVNDWATSFGFPILSVLFWGAMGLCTMIGYATYRLTHQTEASLIMICVSMFMGSLAGLISGIMTTIVAIIAIGIIVLKNRSVI
jgi:hypothetical protein